MIKRFYKEGLAKDNIILFVMLNTFNFLNFIYNIIVARVLTLADYGIFGVLFSIIYIFNVPSEAIQNISSKITSKFHVKGEDGKIKNFAKKSLKIVAIYSLMLFIVMIVISFFISSFLKINIWLLIITNSMIFFLLLSPIPRGILQGKKRFFIFGSSFVLDSLLRVLLTLLFVFIGWKIYGAILGVLLGLAFGFFISLYFIRDIFKEKEESEKIEGYKFGYPFFIMSLVIFVAFSIDTILARRFFSPDVVGSYVALSTLGKIIFFGTASIGKAMFPSASEKHEQNQDSSAVFKKSFIIATTLSLIAVLFYYLVPQLIIKLTVGNKFIGISNLLVFAGLALAILSLTNLILLYGLSTYKIKRPNFLILFIILEIILLTLFHHNLKEYLFALVASNIIMFIGSFLMIIKKS